MPAGDPAPPNMAAIPARELFIDGGWVAPAGGQYLDVISPATEEVVGRIPAATEEDVNAAVAAAVAAHKRGAWGKLSGKQRAEVLRRVADKVWQRGGGGGAAAAAVRFASGPRSKHGRPCNACSQANAHRVHAAGQCACTRAGPQMHARMRPTRPCGRRPHAALARAAGARAQG